MHINTPDVVDVDKWTPLHSACNDGHKEVAQYLVEELKCNTGKFNDIIAIHHFITTKNYLTVM